SSFPSVIAVTSLLVSQYLIGSVYSISNNKAAFPGGTLCPRVRGLDQIRLDFAHRIESQERLHEPRRHLRRQDKLQHLHLASADRGRVVSVGDASLGMGGDLHRSSAFCCLMVY